MGVCKKLKKLWCGQEDSNFHGSLHKHLKLACLPIPPWPRPRYFSKFFFKTQDFSFRLAKKNFLSQLNEKGGKI